jgi:hypothetical protein
VGSALLAASITGLGDFVTNQGIAEQGSSVQTPVTGFSITLATTNHLTLLTPAGTLATGTIIFPTPTVNGQRLRVVTTAAVTALTVSPTGSDTIVGAPTTLAANGSFEMYYRTATATWYPYGVPQSSGSSSPITAGTGAFSAVGGDGSAIALGTASFAYGEGSTQASSEGAYAFGNGTVATGTYSYAFGFECTAGNAFTWASGNSVAVTFAGSAIWGDSGNSSGVNDTGVDQQHMAFRGGFYWHTTPSKTKVLQIDSLGNFTPLKGQAELGYTIQVPTTGFSFTAALTSHLTIFNPIATLATGTIVLPTPTVTQKMRFSFNQTVTALTFTPSGTDSIGNLPTTGLAGTSVEIIYDLPSTKWFVY